MIAVFRISAQLEALSAAKGNGVMLMWALNRHDDKRIGANAKLAGRALFCAPECAVPVSPTLTSSDIELSIVSLVRSYGNVSRLL